MPQENRPIEINERSRVPLSIVGAVIIGTAAVVGMFFRIDARLMRIEQTNTAIWRVQDQKEWIWSARDINREKRPDIVWPDAKTEAR